MKKSNQKSNTEQVYFKTYAHYHRLLPSGNYATISIEGATSMSNQLNDLSFLNEELKPISKNEYLRLFNRKIKSMIGDPEPDGMTYEAITPTEFEVKVVSAGVTVTFNAKCIDPVNGTGNGFDIDIESVETPVGEDLLPFLKAMGLEEFLMYELMERCTKIYVNMDDVEEDEHNHYLEIMEMNRQSYTW